MNFGERARPRPRLSIAPLIDVVFLLLVFFMLASSFVEREEIDLSLPSIDAAPATLPQGLLLVRIAEDGTITLNGLVLELDQLVNELRGRLADDGGRPVTVRADDGVPVRQLVGVMDHLRGARIDNLSLAVPPSGS